MSLLRGISGPYGGTFAGGYGSYGWGGGWWWIIIIFILFILFIPFWGFGGWGGFGPGLDYGVPAWGY